MCQGKDTTPATRLRDAIHGLGLWHMTDPAVIPDTRKWGLLWENGWRDSQKVSSVRDPWDDDVRFTHVLTSVEVCTVLTTENTGREDVSEDEANWWSNGRISYTDVCKY